MIAYNLLSIQKYKVIIMNKKILPIAILCCWPLTGIAVANEDEEDFAEEMSLSDLLDITVETVTKTAEKSSLAPAIITVITDHDIKTFGYDSIATVLSHIAGFVETDDHVMHNFGVRGSNAGVRAGSRTIKFMIDGQPVAFRSTSQHFIGKELIPMDLIKRIEVIRGPASALYGANAFLGVVNVITKKSAAFEKSGHQISLTYNQLQDAEDGYHVSGTAGFEKNDIQAVIGVSTGTTDRGGLQLPAISPEYSSFTNKSVTQDEANPLSLYTKLNWSPSEDKEFQLHAHYQRLDSENPFSDLNALRDTGTTRVAIQNGFVRMNANLNISDHLTSRLFISYSEGNPTKDDRIELGASNFYLTRNIGYKGLDTGAEFILTKDKHTFLFGADASFDDHDLETFNSINRSTGAITAINSPATKSIDNKAIYGQWLYQFKEKWKSIAGFRIDDNSIIDKEQSLRLGIVGELSKDLILKVLYGSSFQAPSPELLFRKAIQNGDIIGNDKLDAQTAQTVEISLSASVSKVLHASGTLFQTKVDDLVTFETGTNNLVAKNSTSSTTSGLELELRYKQNNLSSYLNYTFQKTDRDNNPFTLSKLEEREEGELFPKGSLLI